MSAISVLIVGAGPTGLVLALQLARHGVACRIVDARSGPGQASRAMAVQARTLEFYRQLGFADEVVARGIRMEMFRLRRAGRDVARIVFQDAGRGLSPYPFALCFAQDDHERFLTERLGRAGVDVEWGVALESFTQHDGHVQAVLDADGVRQVCRAAYLCGCDGIHSAVRRGLGVEFPGGTYDQRFYVADVMPDAAFTTDIVVNLGERSFALMMPVRSSGMQRLVGLVPPALADREDVAFEDVRDEAQRLLGIRVREVNWFSAYRVHHRVAARFRVGRAFLAGDAGHVHSPAGGQGMNTGIGDAVNLSWMLAQVIGARLDAAVLDSYEAERIGFARALVATTDRAFRRLVGQGVGSRVLRTWLLPHLAPLITGRPAVQRAIFRTVSQVRVRYRGSPLSAGTAGRVHGGDRLPWVASAAGDNHAGLAALDWRVHVYGTVSAPLAAAAAALGLVLERFDWSEPAWRAGLARDAAYLVRPDGHVALASPGQDARALGEFMRRIGAAPAG